MKHIKLFEGLTPTEKRVISSAFILLLLLLVLVNVYDFNSFGSAENQIGQIQELTNNTRVKSNQKVLWQNARKQQGIHVGDKIFTGRKSTAKVQLGKQGGFSLGENSLVEFQTINREKIANFKNGSYRLFSNGKLKIAINGKVAEIDAKDSEFEVVINGTNNIQIKTIKGSGQIKINNKVTELATNTVAQPLDFKVESKTVVEKAIIPPFTLTYSPKLYDEYQRINGVLSKRPHHHQVVQKSVRLPVPTVGMSDVVYVSHSNDRDFKSNYEHKMFGFDKKIKKVFLGENYWRYKGENESWSDTYNFTVSKEYPAHSKPELHFQDSNLFLIHASVDGIFNISTPYAAMGYVIETSRNGNFDQDSNVSWQKSKTVKLTLSRTGPIFFRARSVDKDFQLSEWSDTHSFNVSTPPELQPIVLKVSSNSIRVGESVFVQWTPQSIIKKYRFHVNKGEKKVLSVPLSASSSDWFPKTPGTYSLSVTATDEFGRDVVSNSESVKVAVPFVLTKAPEPKTRKPAAEEITLENVEETDISTTVDNSPITLNRYYTHSFLTLSTSHMSLKSKALAQQTGDFAQSAVLSMDYLYWMNNHGFQAILQKGLIPLSDGVAESDVLIAEGRYRYRFTPADMADFLKSFQFTGFLGYELYKNSKNDFLLSSYSLPKVGATLDYPMFERFVLGGYASYGFKTGMLRYEYGWDLTYFLRQRMGVGIGSKLSFVEFDLTNEFPGFTNFRESYTQSTIMFKYFF